MRKTIAVLLAVLTASCEGDCYDAGDDCMANRDWNKLAAQNRASFDEKWGLVGRQWDERKKVVPGGTENGDEVRWGSQLVGTFTVAGAGSYIFPPGGIPQMLLTATRPARAWNISCTMTMQGGGAPTGGNALVGAFAIEYGIGSTKVFEYVELTQLNFSRPFSQFPAVATQILTNRPARDIIVSAFGVWINGANNFDDGAKSVVLSAMVAPVYRP